MRSAVKNINIIFLFILSLILPDLSRATGTDEHDCQTANCNEVTDAAEDFLQEELDDDPRFGSKNSRLRPTDTSYSRKTRRTDFDLDKYVNSNAGNPALSRKNPEAQKAFIDPPRPAIWSPPRAPASEGENAEASPNR